MKVVFFSNEKIKEVENVTNVMFEGDNGKFCILENHDRLVSLLSNGEFKYIKNNKEEKINVSEGLVNVKDNIVNVLLTNYSGDIA